MLGWKPVVRTLDGVSFEQAKDALLRQGFVEFDVGEDYAVSKKSGSSLTMNADKVALEAALARQGDTVELQVRYDTFVLFDTGDLEEAADRVARTIRG